MSALAPALIDAAAVASVALLGVIARSVWRGSRGVGQMLEDWRGKPARPGVAAQAGVMERLASIEDTVAEIKHETKPNSGLSMRDDIGRIHQAVTGQPAPGAIQ